MATCDQDMIDRMIRAVRDCRTHRHAYCGEKLPELRIRGGQVQVRVRF